MKAALGLLLGLFACAAHAQLLVPQGTKGTLSVQYQYTAVGKKADKYEPREWRVSRGMNYVVSLKADGQQPLSSMRPMEAGQTADLKDKQTRIASAQKKMAPITADVMKIAERCGDNEDCITKAIQEYSNSVEMTPELKSVGADVTAMSKQGAPRYQAWQPVMQKGTYTVDEFYRGQTADPLCLGKAKQRCNREETRKGGGDIASPPGHPGVSSVRFEVDSQKKDIMFTLPVPMAQLGYTRQVTSDFPDEQSGAGKGVVANLAPKVESLTFVVPADLHSVSGEKTYKFDGEEGESGTLVVKWQFAQQ